MCGVKLLGVIFQCGQQKLSYFDIGNKIAVAVAIDLRNVRQPIGVVRAVELAFVLPLIQHVLHLPSLPVGIAVLVL